MEFSHQLAIQVMPELYSLLRVALKKYLELQAMLIDVQQYNPTWVKGCISYTLGVELHKQHPSQIGG